MEDAASTPETHFHTSPNTSGTAGTDSNHRRSPSGAEDGSESSSMTGSEDFEMDDIDSGHGFEDDEETGLTSSQRHQRTRRKRRNTQMDERIAPDVDMRKEEDRLTNRTVWTTILINTVLIALWYLFSISISVVSSKNSPRFAHS
jgi:solute carrier family 35 protein C2